MNANREILTSGYGSSVVFYTGAQLADIFSVTSSAVHYWRKNGKLTPGRIEKRENNNTVYWYSQIEVIKFLLKTHAGGFQPSNLDCESAIINMNINAVLPVTKRYLTYESEYKITDKWKKAKEKLDPPQVLIIPSNARHLNARTHKEYIKQLTKFRTKLL